MFVASTLEFSNEFISFSKCSTEGQFNVASTDIGTIIKTTLGLVLFSLVCKIAVAWLSISRIV